MPEIAGMGEWNDIEKYGIDRETVWYLQRVFELDAFETFVVTYLAMGEIDPGIRAAMEALREQGDGFFSILSLIRVYQELTGKAADSTWFRAFLKGDTLADWMLEHDGPGGFDFRETLRLSRRVRSLLFAGQWDLPEMEEAGIWFWPMEEEERIAGRMFGETEYLRWSRRLKTGENRAVCLEGPKGIGKKTQVRRFAREMGRPVFFGDARKIAAWPKREEEMRLRAMMLECRLKQAVLCLDHVGSGDWDGERGIFLERICRLAQTHLPGILLLTEERAPAMGDLYRVRFSMPDLAESARLWNTIGAGYPLEAGIRLEEFAGSAAMSPGQIQRIFRQAMQLAGEAGAKVVSRPVLKSACTFDFDQSAVRKTTTVPLKYNFSDLILPSKRLRQLREACSQVKNRYQVYEKWGFSGKQVYGVGISMVFSGPPGTGKTMAAQIMAKELGLQLYKVDLAAVVSKYIGETEKNLNQIFEEGKRSQAILFFDEADVLFSKRTEVKDSHDKYNNMEAAFMLQKMEEYTGLVILATNYMQNIDEAFKRRLTFVIEFPSPDLEHRRKLWESVIPGNLPLKEDLDLDFLAAQFEMSGSQIKNSMINGAFFAADQGKDQVGMEDVLRAVVRELEKSGRKLTRKDLAEYGFLLEGVDGSYGI